MVDLFTATFLTQLNDDMANIVETVRKSLVQVSTGNGQGAGTIWHRDGLIVTNAHVVANMRGRGRYRQQVSDTLEVTLPDGKTLPARILAQDTERDLAALAIEATVSPT